MRCVQFAVYLKRSQKNICYSLLPSKRSQTMIRYLRSLKNKTKLQADPINSCTDPAFFFPQEIIKECQNIVTEALNFDAITHKNEKFTLKNNDHNKRLSYNLTDDKGELIFKVFDNNAKSFPVISPQELIAKNSDIIDALYRSLLMENAFFNNNILPYIKRAASICLTLPASEGFHDAQPGGLFRHLLCTAFESINRYFDHYDINDSLRKRNLKCTLFLAGLYHDIAKVVTDFSIYNNKNDHFNPHIESLHHFCLRTKATELIVFFNSSRQSNHDELHLIGLFLLTSGLPQIFSYINADIPLNDFYLKKSALFKSVQMADAKCAKASASVAGPYTLNINTYLIVLLLKFLNNSDVNELKDKGIFVVPYGVLIAYDSMVLNDLNAGARENFREENKENRQDWLHLSRQWSKQGYILASGKYKVYAWHKVITSHGKYFVYGLTIKFNVQRLQNIKTLLSNAIPLGEAPSLINDLIKNYGDKYPGIVCVDNNDPKITDALNPYENEKDNEEILITPIFGEDIKESAENAYMAKSLKAQYIADEKQHGILDAQEVIRKNELSFHTEFATEKLKTGKLSDVLQSPILNKNEEESSSPFALPENLDERENEEENDRIDLAEPQCPAVTKLNDYEDFYQQDFKHKSSVQRDLLLKNKKSPYKTTINFPKVQKIEQPGISLKLESWLGDYNRKLVKPSNSDELENNQEK